MHHVTGADKRHGDHGGVRHGGREPRNASFSLEQEGRFGAFGARALGKDTDRFVRLEERHGAGQGVTCATFTVGFDLTCGVHEPLPRPGDKVTVLGEVVCLPPRGHDDHDRVDVGHVVRGQDHRAVARDVVESTHAQPEEEPHAGIEQDANAAVIRIAKFDLVRRPDAASGDNGRPSLLSCFAHTPPSVHEVSTFTAAGHGSP